MNDFATDRDADLADIFDSSDGFAEDAVYQSPVPGVAAVACQVLINERQQLILQDGDAQQMHRMWDIEVRISQVALPVRNGTFTVAAGDHAGTFTIVTPGTRNAGVVACSCRKATIRDVAADGAHRIQQ